MKSFSEMMYGEDYTKRLAQFNTKLEEVKENYGGEFETDSLMYVMHTHQTNGTVKFDIDENVPADLKADFLKVFNEVWN